MKFQSQFTIQKGTNLMTPEAERFNGWAAMLGFVAAVGAYATTGNIIPGIYKKKKEIEKEKLVAEKLNGRLAMLGIIAGLGAYLTTGQIIPGFV